MIKKKVKVQNRNTGNWAEVELDDPVANEQEKVMRAAAWDMYASAALGMSMHPGTTRDKARPLTVAEVCDIADTMMRERDRRFKNETV